MANVKLTFPEAKSLLRSLPANDLNRKHVDDAIKNAEERGGLVVLDRGYFPKLSDAELGALIRVSSGASSFHEAPIKSVRGSILDQAVAAERVELKSVPALDLIKQLNQAKAPKLLALHDELYSRSTELKAALKGLPRSDQNLQVRQTIKQFLAGANAEPTPATQAVTRLLADYANLEQEKPQPKDVKARSAELALKLTSMGSAPLWDARRWMANDEQAPQATYDARLRIFDALQPSFKAEAQLKAQRQQS